jgi:hypothetical protein
MILEYGFLREIRALQGIGRFFGRLGVMEGFHERIGRSRVDLTRVLAILKIIETGVEEGGELGSSRAGFVRGSGF